MRFVRLGLAFYAAALLSGCQSVRKQPPATLDPVRIPPARDGEYAPESPRIRSSIAEDPEGARPRGPVKSIGWPRFGLRRQSGNAECSDNCDGSPQQQLDSPGAIGEPSLAPRGPSSVRADYGSPQPRVTPVPEAGPAPIPRTIPGRPRVPVQPAEPSPPVTIEEPALVVPPEVPAAVVPPSRTRQTPGSGGPENALPGRPSLPPVLVEDPPMSLPQTAPVPEVPEVPELPAVPELPPAVPAAPAFPDPPALTQPESSSSASAAPAPSANSSKTSTKTKSKSTTPRKTTTPRSTEDDAVLEERLRQSAERMRSSGQKAGSKAAPAKPAPAEAGDGVTDPPLWPKRFGGSPPVGEPVIDPLPESVVPSTPPAPPAVSQPAPMPAPQPMPQPPVAAPEAPAEAPPAIPGLPPTIDLDDEIPRPPRTAPASPSPTSFRPRGGRSI